MDVAAVRHDMHFAGHSGQGLVSGGNFRALGGLAEAIDGPVKAGSCGGGQSPAGSGPVRMGEAPSISGNKSERPAFIRNRKGFGGESHF